jgi:hypothetical protein
MKPLAPMDFGHGAQGGPGAFDEPFPAHQPPSEPGGPAAPNTSSDTLVREEFRTDQGDHERFAHYVRQDKIIASAVSGKPVVALCGKVWVPKRDPSRFPLCPACKEIYMRMGLRGDPP